MNYQADVAQAETENSHLYRILDEIKEAAHSGEWSVVVRLPKGYVSQLKESLESWNYSVEHFTTSQWSLTDSIKISWTKKD